MRICAVPAGEGGVAFYRIHQPYNWIKDQGLADVYVFDFKVNDNSRLEQEMQHSDIIVFQCPWNTKMLETIKLIKSGTHGKEKKVVIEYDDNFFNVNPFNQKYGTFGTEEMEIFYKDQETIDLIKKIPIPPWVRQTTTPEGWLKLDFWRDGFIGFNREKNTEIAEAMKEAISIADLVTVTTMGLGEQLREYRPEGAIVPLPNLYDPERWLPMQKNDTDMIRIGWQGGSAHFHDLHIVATEIEKICKKYPNVKLVIAGNNFPALFSEIPDRQKEFHNWHSDINTYPLHIRKLKLDIGICPLIDDPFNRGKSSLKYIEYSAMNIPTIASPTVYGDVIKHKKTGLIANNKQEWFDCMKLLITNKQLRRKYADQAHEWVEHNYGIDKSLLWFKVLEDLHEGRIKTIYKPKGLIINE